MDWALHQQQVLPLIFPQNAPNMSISSGIRRERFKIDLRGEGAATEQRKFLSLSGRRQSKRSTGPETLHQARVLGWGREKSFTTLTSNEVAVDCRNISISRNIKKRRPLCGRL